jgi:hypothetical protein
LAAAKVVPVYRSAQTVLGMEPGIDELPIRGKSAMSFSLVNHAAGIPLRQVGESDSK